MLAQNRSFHLYLYCKFWHSQKWRSMLGPSAKMKNSFGFDFVMVIHSSDNLLVWRAISNSASNQICQYSDPMRDSLLLAISQSVNTHGAKVITPISADRGSLVTWNWTHPAQKNICEPKTYREQPSESFKDKGAVELQPNS